MSNSRTIRLQIAATETHCDGCQHNHQRHCDVFGRRVRPQEWDEQRRTWKRMSECIAAEEAGK